MSISTFTTIDKQFNNEVLAIIENIKNSDLHLTGIHISFDNQKLEMVFGGGFDNFSYYSLCYLLQEITLNYCRIENSNIKSYFNEEFLIILNKNNSDLSEDDKDILLHWVQKNHYSIEALKDSNIEYIRPLSQKELGLFSSKRKYKKIIDKLFV